MEMHIRNFLLLVLVINALILLVSVWIYLFTDTVIITIGTLMTFVFMNTIANMLLVIKEEKL